MTRLRSLAAVGSLATALAVISGCSTVPLDDSVTTGAVAVQSSNSPAEGFLGEMADKMDDVARTDYLAAQNEALDAGGKVSFLNKTMGAQGSVMSGPSALASLYPDLECRRYSSVVWVLGQGKLVEGDACRQDDGPWQAMGYTTR